jgi:hypothetical protein
MSGVLDQILASKRERLGRAEYAAPPGTAIPAANRGRFMASLREPGVRIIAEIKHRSPSAGEILPGADGKIETFALAYRRGHAAAISVVTEEDHFGGKPAWIARAKRISGLPILMKGLFLGSSSISRLWWGGRGAKDRRRLPAPEPDRAPGVERGLATASRRTTRKTSRAAEGLTLGVNARDLGFRDRPDATRGVWRGFPPARAAGGERYPN